MTRFAWLQARNQTFVGTLALAVLAAVAVVTGLQLTHVYDTVVVPCRSLHDCDTAVGQFLSKDSLLQNAFTLLLRAVPALVGMFWGVPLLTREFETGTFRLAWTQTVSRRRWLLTKLVLVGLATFVLAALLTLAMTWWYRDIDQVAGVTYSAFDTRDVAPVSYAVFAFFLGALVGAVIRRTLPAMATTLAAFVFVRVAMTLWVRPHLLTPMHSATSLLTSREFGLLFRSYNDLTINVRAAGPKGSWVLGSDLVNQAGHAVSTSQAAAFVHGHCPGIQAGLPSPTAMDACRQSVARAFHFVVTYQPASNYWTFQWLESGIFLALSLAAAAACYVWVTRRTA